MPKAKTKKPETASFSAACVAFVADQAKNWIREGKNGDEPGAAKAAYDLLIEHGVDVGSPAKTVFNSGTERFENEVTGRPAQKLFIEVVESKTDKVVRRLGPFASTRQREKADWGLSRQLNHERFYTRDVEESL